MKKFFNEIGKYIKFKIRQFIESRFFLGLVMLSIGASSSIIYYEGTPLIRHIQTGYSYSTELIGRQGGNVVEAHAETVLLEKPDVVITDDNVYPASTSLSIDELADYIWLHESSRGKNNYSKCEAVGKINSIGYAIYDGKWMCFNSHEEEMQTLNKWLTNKKEVGLSDTELLCLYSGSNYSICKK